MFVTVTGLDLSLGLPTEVDCGNTGFQQVTCFLNRPTDPVQSVYFTVPICSMGRTVTISVRPDGVDPFPVDNSYVVDGAPIPAEWVTSCAPRPTPSSPVPAPSSPAGGHGSGGSGGSISTGSGGGPAPVASPTGSAASTTVHRAGVDDRRARGGRGRPDPHSWSVHIRASNRERWMGRRRGGRCRRRARGRRGRFLVAAPPAARHCRRARGNVVLASRDPDPRVHPYPAVRKRTSGPENERA